MTAPLPAVEARTTPEVPPTSHAEDPANPGRGLCGARLSARRASGSRFGCVVCLGMMRGWTAR